MVEPEKALLESLDYGVRESDLSLSTLFLKDYSSRQNLPCEEISLYRSMQR